MAGAQALVSSTMDAVLKELYLGPVTETLNNKVLMLQRIKASDAEIVGREAVVPLHSGRSAGIGARGETDTLPTAGNQTYDKAVYTLAQLYGAFQITGLAMELTKNDLGSFVRGLQSEMDGLRRDLIKDSARQFYGNGDGALGTIPSGATSATQTLASDEGLRKGWFYKNRLCDVGTAANPTASATGKIVSSINIANKTVTFTTSVTSSNSDIVSNSGSNKANGTNETNGLQNIVPTANNTLGGIDGSANSAYWGVQFLDNGGALSESNMLSVWNACGIASGEDPTIAICSKGVQRAFYNLKQSQQRFQNTTQFTGGFTALEFMGQPLVADIDCPFGKIYFLNENDLLMSSNMDWNFLDSDGHVLKQVSGKDAWAGYLRRYIQFGARNRVSQGVLFNITDSTGS